MPVEDLWDAEIAKRNRAPKEANTVYIGEPLEGNCGESAAETYDAYKCEQMVYECRPKAPDETPEPDYDAHNPRQTNLDRIEDIAAKLKNEETLMAIVEVNRKTCLIVSADNVKIKPMRLCVENMARANRQAQIDMDYQTNFYR